MKIASTECRQLLSMATDSCVRNVFIANLWLFPTIYSFPLIVRFAGLELRFVVGHRTIRIELVPIASHLATLCDRNPDTCGCKQSWAPSPHQRRLLQACRQEAKEPRRGRRFRRQEGTLRPIGTTQTRSICRWQGSSHRHQPAQGQEIVVQIPAFVLCIEFKPMSTPFAFLDWYRLRYQRMNRKWNYFYENKWIYIWNDKMK